MNLTELINHCGKVAEKELLETGECSSTFAAVDPVGSMTLIILPPLDLLFLGGMLRTYCGAFRTEIYAVTATMWQRPDTPDGRRVETVMVTGSSRTEQLIWTKPIIRGAGGVSLGSPRVEPVQGGYLAGLLQPTEMPNRDRKLLQVIWKARYEPVLNLAMDRSGSN